MFRRLIEALKSLFKPKPPPELPADALIAPIEFQQGVEAFAWRVLCASYARVIFRMEGRDSNAVSKRETSAALLPYYPDILRDAKALGAAIARARAEGIGELQRALHRAEGIDHEMLDQAILYALEVSKARKT